MRQASYVLTLCLIVGFWSKYCAACPFCSAVSQTLTQEMDAADVSVIARLVKLPDDGLSGDGLSDDVPLDLDLDLDLNDPDSGSAEFEIVEVIRGQDAPAVGTKIKVVYFGTNEQKKTFLINGFAGDRLDWTTPLPLTLRGADYIRQLGTLPKEGPDRLAFFLNHLEDEDPLLAQDAYDEFGRAPYEEVIAVGDRMNRQQLIKWIEDEEVGPTRRRLYLTMLGICGQPEDIDFLESLLSYDYQRIRPGMAAGLAAFAQSGPVAGLPLLNEMVKADVRRKQQCLDALIAAYLKLQGPAGLPLIETRFLTNPAAEYTQVYAAMMALRFHGEESDEIPKERLLETVRLLLDNTDAADQVIPDLARWEDWTVMDKLVAKFEESEPNGWIRQPVIAYLLAASEQPPEIADRANVALTKLEKIDPKGVKMARNYMAFGLLARTRAKKKEPADEQVSPEENLPGAKKTTPGDQASGEKTIEVAAVSPEQEANLSAPPLATTTLVGPSRLMIIGGPLVAGVFFFCIFALLLRGTDVRSGDSNS